MSLVFPTLASIFNIVTLQYRDNPTAGRNNTIGAFMGSWQKMTSVKKILNLKGHKCIPANTAETPASSHQQMSRKDNRVQHQNVCWDKHWIIGAYQRMSRGLMDEHNQGK